MVLNTKGTWYDTVTQWDNKVKSETINGLSSKIMIEKKKYIFGKHKYNIVWPDIDEQGLKTLY